MLYTLHDSNPACANGAEIDRLSQNREFNTPRSKTTPISGIMRNTKQRLEVVRGVHCSFLVRFLLVYPIGETRVGRV
jgi:hypothetical protein